MKFVQLQWLNFQAVIQAMIMGDRTKTSRQKLARQMLGTEEVTNNVLLNESYQLWTSAK